MQGPTSSGFQGASLCRSHGRLEIITNVPVIRVTQSAFGIKLLIRPTPYKMKGFATAGSPDLTMEIPSSSSLPTRKIVEVGSTAWLVVVELRETSGGMNLGGQVVLFKVCDWYLVPTKLISVLNIKGINYLVLL